MRCSALLALITATLIGHAGESSTVTWAHLPHAGYFGEELWLTIAREAKPAIGEIETLAGASITLSDDGTGLGVRLDPRGHAGLVVHAPSGAEAGRVLFIEPGAGDGIQFDTDGRLRRSGQDVVLVLPRREASGDRRWQLLRGDDRNMPRCSLFLRAPDVRPGESPTLALIGASQSIDPRDQGVVVAMPGGDRFVGWRHRAYRQAVAWLVADLHARGAQRVVLVQAPAPDLDRELIEPLWAQVRDVARSYEVEQVEVTVLGAAEHWQIAESDTLLGGELNDGGLRAYEALLRPYVRPELEIGHP